MLSLTEEVLLSGSGIPAACLFLTSLNKIFYIQIQQAMEQDRLRRMESTEQENGIPWSASQDEVTSFNIGDVITRHMLDLHIKSSSVLLSVFIHISDTTAVTIYKSDFEKME